MSEIAEKTHALLSPSGASRWTRCPGSVVLEQGMPDSSSVHARWGTVCHEVGAMILERAVRGEVVDKPVWSPENAEGYIGRIFTVEGYEIEFDMEMADCVNDYVAHVESFWTPGDIMLVEQEVPLEQITGERDATGTSDCIILHNEEIIVIDLKGGKGVMVDAEENEQGLMYAAGAAHEHDLMHGPFTRVRIVIIQPRLQHVSEWSLDWIEFTGRVAVLKSCCATEVNEALVLGGANATPDEVNDAGLLNPGEKQCRFCKAKATCPALQGAVSEALHHTTDPIRDDEWPDLSLPKQAAAAVPDAEREIDGDKLATAWKSLALVEQWVSAVRDLAHTRLHDGLPVGDLCLYEGKAGNRAWADESAAEELMKKARLKVDEMYTKKVLSYPAAEKALKGKPVWAKLAPLVTRSDPKPTVGVAGDEKRKPWVNCAPESFPELSAEPSGQDPLFS